MPPDSTIIRLGTDSSGRPILASRYLADLWERVVTDIGFRPTIVQGSYMSLAGGGASESAGYHDKSGCFDLRTWDLTVDQIETLVRTLRRYGIAAWRRDHEHGGFDPHIHFVCGTDPDLAPGAAGQWRDYLAGHDGLAGRGPDYEWRPTPLITTPPEEDMTPDQDARLKAVETKVDVLGAAVAKLVKSFGTFRDNEWKRDVKEAARLQRIEEQTAPEKKEK